MESKRLSHEVFYSGRVFDLIIERVEYPSGAQAVREIARHPGGAATVPLTDDGRVLLVRQMRFPLGRFITEIPAGKLSPGEDPAQAAARELAEETGYDARRMEKLAAVYTSPGFCDELLHLYLGRGLVARPEGPRREEGEQSMTLESVPLADAVQNALNGTYQDAKTILGLLLTERLLMRGSL
ncbi:MAG TPA: NUDIX hydrolase [Bacteroidota bacterium]|nr:NUDIX hydrolase [Bacteroidota bacterium]